MSRSAEVSERLRVLADAACTSEIGPAELQELSGLLRADGRARRFYAAYCRMHAELYFAIRAERAAQTARQSAAEEDTEFGVQGSESGVGVAVELPHQPETPDSEALIPPIIIDTSPTIHYPLFTIHSSLGGWLFSYGVATVLMGVAILGAWAYKVSLEAEIARDQPRPAPQGDEPKPEYVGRITGTADCQWADPQDAPPAAVSVGRKYALASGLLEISYETGAKVILQGPCAYEVESAHGGFLALGKLTARVEKGSGFRVQGPEETNPKSQILNQQISNPQSPIPNPLFSIRTPTAVVTDLGTEFGVEVGGDGTCEVHVLKGAVAADFVGVSGHTSPAVRINEGEARRFERGTGHTAMIPVRRAEFESMRTVSADGRRERWLAYSEELRKDSALVAYYTFQPPAGGSPSVLPNQAAAGAVLDGRIEGAEWVHGRWPGKFGLYFHGPGSGDEVALPWQDRFNFTGPFSVAVWFRAERFTGMWETLIAKGDTSWRLQQARDTHFLEFGTDHDQNGEPVCHDVIGHTGFADGRWHLAAAVYEPVGRIARKRLYLDGRLEGEGEAPLPLHHNDEAVWLGANADRNRTNREFHGAIDEAAIFTRALSRDEVAAMFGAGKEEKQRKKP